MNKTIFTAIAGYAAGLAVAMKLRKDNGTSKLGKKAKDTTLENVMDEIVDIHKTAFTEAKKFVATNFDDVHDMESLQKKVGEMVDDFSGHADKVVASLKDASEDKVTAAKEFFEDAYAKVNASLEKAQNKANGFGDDSAETAKKLFDDSKAKIEKTYADMKKKFDKASA